MLFEKFFNAISSLWPATFMAGNLDQLARLNPDRIYIENVRASLNVSSRTAVLICEAAVRQGVFLKFVEVSCPDGRVPASAPTEAELPPTVRCFVEEGGFVDEVELPTSTLRKTVFYRLADDEETDAESYAETA